MGRIITWTLTEEHRKQIPAWNERWIQTIMSTEAMTEEDRAIVRRAINGMYDAAKSARPKAIVFVRGPIEGAIVAGAAAAWWHAKKNGMPVAKEAVNWVIDNATGDATSGEAHHATLHAVGTDPVAYAVLNATKWTITNATRDVIGDPTDAAVRAAVAEATSNKVVHSMDEAADVADHATLMPPHGYAAFAETTNRVESVTDAVTMATTDAVHRATNDWAGDAIKSATHTTAKKATMMTHSAFNEVVGVVQGATMAATYDATGDAVKAAVSRATTNEVMQVTADASVAPTATETKRNSPEWFSVYVVTGASASTVANTATVAATEDAVVAAVSDGVRDRTGRATRDAAVIDTKRNAPDWTATKLATGSDVAWVTIDAVPEDSIKGVVDDALNVETATRNATMQRAQYATTVSESDTIISDRDQDLLNVVYIVRRSTVDAAAAAADLATRAALEVVGDTDFARQCIAAATNMRNGGNEWASWCCFLSFVRDVVGFKDESHAAYKHYEDCAIHSGWRYMHSEFVIVCDRPLRRVTRMVGDRYQLHCEDGPAIEWRDGNVAWYIEGVRVDRQIVMAPETQTVAQIDAEQNADVKEIRIRRFGWPRYLQESGARVVDSRICEVTNTTEALMETKDGNRRLMVTCPTRRRFAPGVPREIKTCEEAQRWLAGPFGQARVVART